MRLIAFFWLALILPTCAAEVNGVPQIVDADTVYVGALKIRLQGIDAPEMDQVCLDQAGKTWQCGIEARSALEHHSAGRSWLCRTSGADRYGRALGTCFVEGRDLNGWLVSEGWALAFRRYSLNYVTDEDVARAAQRGLWKGSFVAPWDWRRRGSATLVLGANSVPTDAQKTMIARSLTEKPPAPNCTIKGNLRATPACIYHLPGGQFYDRLVMTDTKTRRWFCSEAEAVAAGCRRSKL
ncbi:thermonuclease family protein [Bradyrhizobium sp. CCBAU 53338]|uniref:thermonuclease family protein n=1 Tax=Bradyrhizobium sp. CCBAU 53338 TaxID=1325111 RepID=UPI001889EE7B|nr:thermonuclease family protein [Bradyrhizobium sp. CCBAU 53338]QOZ51524.1 thermonuclease family protein [Bradyrhizobium sp. CCBAU 53338]